MPNAASKDTRSIGAYYTPRSITDLLADWAIRVPSDRVLEPSFGGCQFIDSIKDAFKALGQNAPEKHIWGCDIDADAFDYLSSSLGPVMIGYHQRFLMHDFLKTNSRSFSREKFDVVIGNPPYLAHHLLSDEQKCVGAMIREESGMTGRKSQRANLWWYFILHSLSFLEMGGRIAFVLPSSFLKANYTASLHEVLCSRFERCTVIDLKGQFFKSQGACQRTCILLAEGWDSSSDNFSDITFKTAFNEHELARLLASREKESATDKLMGDIEVKNDLLSQGDISLLNSMSALQGRTLLRDCASIRIGVVVGDSRYLLFNKSRALKERLDVAEYFDQILTTLKGHCSLKVSATDIRALVRQDKRCLLLSGNPVCMKSSIYRNYIHAYPADKIASNKTFERREKWYAPDIQDVPDAFLTYMSKDGPRILLNDAKVNCTNTVHRVYFPSGKSYKDKKLIAISMLTTYTQINAELVARYYGIGTLKYEPGEAGKLPLLLPTGISAKEVDSKYSEIDKLLKDGKDEAARITASKFILNQYYLGSVAESTIDKLESVLNALRSFRIM